MVACVSPDARRDRAVTCSPDGRQAPAILVVDGEMRLAWLEVKMNEAKS